MAAKFCLSDDDALVDICIGRIGSHGYCADHAQFSGDKSGVDEPGQQPAIGMIMIFDFYPALPIFHQVQRTKCNICRWGRQAWL